jgi:hypothetical protein
MRTIGQKNQKKSLEPSRLKTARIYERAQGRQQGSEGQKRKKGIPTRDLNTWSEI